MAKMQGKAGRGSGNKKALLEQLKGKENVTKSGQKMNLYANIGNVCRCWQLSLKNDAGGIGLFRSEFLYLENDTFPTEEQQFTVYKTGCGKYGWQKGYYPYAWILEPISRWTISGLEKEENPAMGYRAIRICLDTTGNFQDAAPCTLPCKLCTERSPLCSR